MPSTTDYHWRGGEQEDELHVDRPSSCDVDKLPTPNLFALASGTPVTLKPGKGAAAVTVRPSPASSAVPSWGSEVEGGACPAFRQSAARARRMPAPVTAGDSAIPVPDVLSDVVSEL